VLRFIEEQNDGKCPLWKIGDRFRKFKQWERKEILDNLLETKAIRITEEKTEGKQRSQQFYVINRTAKNGK